MPSLLARFIWAWSHASFLRCPRTAGPPATGLCPAAWPYERSWTQIRRPLPPLTDPRWRVHLGACSGSIGASAPNDSGHRAETAHARAHSGNTRAYSGALPFCDRRTPHVTSKQRRGCTGRFEPWRCSRSDTRTIGQCPFISARRTRPIACPAFSTRFADRIAPSPGGP